MENNYFKQLNSIDFKDKKEQKGNLTYLSWAYAWGELKNNFPDATYQIYERDQVIETTEVTKYEKVEQDLNNAIMGSPESVVTITKKSVIPVNYFTDGRTCWVKVGVTVNGIEHIEELPVMDNKNKPVSVAVVTSTDVNKTIQRAMTKAIARHGLGLYIYAGEDLPTVSLDNVSATAQSQESFEDLKQSVIDLITGCFNTMYEADVDKFIRETFQGKRISDTTEADMDKLFAAKTYLGTLIGSHSIGR